MFSVQSVGLCVCSHATSSAESTLNVCIILCFIFKLKIYYRIVVFVSILNIIRNDTDLIQQGCYEMSIDVCFFL